MSIHLVPDAFLAIRVGAQGLGLIRQATDLEETMEDAEADASKPEALGVLIDFVRAYWGESDEANGLKPYDRIEGQVASVSQLTANGEKLVCGMILHRRDLSGTESGLKMLQGLKEPQEFATTAQGRFERVPSSCFVFVAAREEEPSEKASEILDGAIGLVSAEGGCPDLQRLGHDWVQDQLGRDLGHGR